MSDRYNSRGIDGVKAFSFHSPPADLGISEPLRLSRYQNISSLTSQTEGQNPVLAPEIGSIHQTYDGRIFKYVKAADALSEGQVVELGTQVDVANFTSASSDLTEFTKSAAGWTLNQYRGYYLFTYSGNNQGVMRRIIGNTTDTLKIEEALAGAFAATDDGYIVSPHLVKKHTASNIIPAAGVSIGTIGAGNTGWIQVFGWCEGVLIDAALDGTSTYWLTPSNATAGNAEQVLGAGPTIYLSTAFATVPSQVGLGFTNKGIPAFLWGCIF